MWYVCICNVKGSTYVRYSRLDGNSSILRIREEMFAVHYEEHPLDYETEYAKDDKAKKINSRCKEERHGIRDRSARRSLREEARGDDSCQQK